MSQSIKCLWHSLGICSLWDSNSILLPSLGILKLAIMNSPCQGKGDQEQRSPKSFPFDFEINSKTQCGLDPETCCEATGKAFHSTEPLSMHLQNRGQCGLVWESDATRTAPREACGGFYYVISAPATLLHIYSFAIIIAIAFSMKLREGHGLRENSQVHEKWGHGLDSGFMTIVWGLQPDIIPTLPLIVHYPSCLTETAPKVIGVPWAPACWAGKCGIGKKSWGLWNSFFCSNPICIDYLCRIRHLP